VTAGNEGLVFIDFAVAILPLVILPTGECHPTDQAQRADPGAGRTALDEVDDHITGVVSNPASAQLSPSSLFVLTSAMTPEVRHFKTEVLRVR
jgi:hypothetical protein